MRDLSRHVELEDQQILLSTRREDTNTCTARNFVTKASSVSKSGSKSSSSTCNATIWKHTMKFANTRRRDVRTWAAGEITTKKSSE